MTRTPSPLVLRLALLALLLGAPVASAQDDDGPDTADLEDRERVEDLVRSLNSPMVLSVPGQVRDRIERLLSSRHPMARRALRDLLLDTGARSVVVEQVITSVIVDRGALDLVEDVVERLRVEQNSSLARSFDDLLLRYADTALVRRLAELARDEDRSAGYRATAAATLGRTGHVEALYALVELWGDASSEVRTAASRGVVRIVPFVRTREDAQRLVADIREQQLPLSEVLRRRLRELVSEKPSAATDELRGPYRELALASLPHAPLDEVLALYLGSPLAEVRTASAVRLRDVDWTAEADPAQAQRAAGKALLGALRTEESVDVEAEILDTLIGLAPALRENVDDEELAALLLRARAAGGAPPPVRRSALRVLGALRDRRPIAALEEEFDELGDTDPELRIEILAALGPSGGELTGWLARRALAEPDVRVALEIVLKLGKDPSPSAVGVFVQLLKDRHPDERVRLYAVQSLALQWANNGVERARDAIIDYGLQDTEVAIRESSASGLRTAGTGDPAIVLGALARVVAREDENVKVRVAAARAILDVDDVGALPWLRPAFAAGAIWDVYRNRRVQDLRGGHVAIDDLLRDADALWEDEDAALRERAVQLLQAVVDSGSDLWESARGRGLVRERLVERLLATGRPADACMVAEGLLAATPREDDPRARWRLLLGRALRASGSLESLARAESELTALRDDAALPADLRAPVLLELGHTQLLRDDPTAALQALLAAEEGASGLPPEDAARLRTLVGEARERSDAERLRVLALVDRISENAAQDELRKLGRRAARHLDVAIAAASLAGDLPRLRQLLLATAALARRTFDVPADATAVQLADVVAEARKILAAAIAGTASDEQR